MTPKKIITLYRLCGRDLTWAETVVVICIPKRRHIVSKIFVRKVFLVDCNILLRHSSIRLRTRAIFLFCCPRLRRKRAHRQNRQHHAHRKCCTEKSRTLFSHVLFPFSFVILQATTPKGTVCSSSLPPPPYNISRGILLENRFEFFSGIVEMFAVWPAIPGNIQKQ